MAAAKDQRKIAERYANALFQLAETENSLPKVEGELAQLQSFLEESDDFRRLCLSPIMTRHSQHQGLKLLAEKAGMSLLTARFLILLADNRRAALLPDIIHAFNRQLHAYRGETKASIVSARKLKKAQTDKLNKLLEDYTGKKIIPELREDPEILGGVRIECDGLLIDATISGQLERLTDTLYRQIQQAA